MKATNKLAYNVLRPAATRHWRPPAAGLAAMATASNEKRLINLIRGWPAPAILPVEQLARASAKALSEPSVFVPALQYGPDPGYQPLREELATYLSHNFDVPRDASRICITGGASQSAACILQSFTDRPYTKGVWMAAPCYHLMCPIFEDSGFRGRLHAVPEDDNGIDIQLLERGLASVPVDPDETVGIAFVTSLVCYCQLTCFRYAKTSVHTARHIDISSTVSRPHPTLPASP